MTFMFRRISRAALAATTTALRQQYAAINCHPHDRVYAMSSPHIINISHK